MLSRRHMTEWGSLALVDRGEGDDADGKAVSLPGVTRGDHSARHWKPEVRVSCVQFSPSGEWEDGGGTGGREIGKEGGRERGGKQRERGVEEGGRENVRVHARTCRLVTRLQVVGHGHLKQAVD